MRQDEPDCHAHDLGYGHELVLEEAQVQLRLHGPTFPGNHHALKELQRLRQTQDGCRAEAE